MKFSVPERWEDLSQEQLRYVFRMIWAYGSRPDWELHVQTSVLVRFCGIEVERRTDSGWLCREHRSGCTFVIADEILPQMIERVAWVTRMESLTVRIEKIGSYTAVDFELQGLPFGKYLEAENNFQSYLLSKSESCLTELAKILYRVPEDAEGWSAREEELSGCFFWFNAVKLLLGTQFPNFLRPTGGEGGNPITQESLVGSMRAQIRLLTKGDLTKQQYILNKIDTWTALTELDALAKEAEEIKRKYGK